MDPADKCKLRVVCATWTVPCLHGSLDRQTVHDMSVREMCGVVTPPTHKLK